MNDRMDADFAARPDDGAGDHGGSGGEERAVLDEGAVDVRVRSHQCVVAKHGWC